ncbi:MAG TPA: pyrroline-5-carboxylate reductase, partial [Opitutae bacterium]|nr:pyrroline-5-carboxylate reductase [Opitutae bacterium]
MIKNDTKIVFIGAGRMASAIIRGLIEKEHYKPVQIACTCGNDSTGARLAKETKIQYLDAITDEIQSVDAIVLACKPQQFNQIEKSITNAANGRLVLSILAGIPLNRLSEKFKLARNIVRTMPNTPGQIGAGVTAYSPRS